jgi:hypothetical protein
MEKQQRKDRKRFATSPSLSLSTIKNGRVVIIVDFIVIKS